MEGFTKIVHDDGRVEWVNDRADELIAEAAAEGELNTDGPVLTQEEVDYWANSQYKRSRHAEYPPIEDYLDGIVKGDQDQIDAYIAACQAVKDKYPKPE